MHGDLSNDGIRAAPRAATSEGSLAVPTAYIANTRTSRRLVNPSQSNLSRFPFSKTVLPRTLGTDRSGFAPRNGAKTAGMNSLGGNIGWHSSMQGRGTSSISAKLIYLYPG
jgi:hypothetical protein